MSDEIGKQARAEAETIYNRWAVTDLDFPDLITDFGKALSAAQARIRELEEALKEIARERSVLWKPEGNDEGWRFHYGNMRDIARRVLSPTEKI